MINLLKADLYKLFKNKSFYICLILSILFSYMTTMMNFAYNSFSNAQSMYSLLQMPELNGIYMLKTSFGVGMLFYSIFIAIFIASEFSWQTIKNIVSRGFSREKIYISKLISCSLTSIIITFSYVLVAILYATIKSGFGKLPSHFVLSLIKMILLECLVVISITSLFVMIVFLIKGIAGSVATNLLINFFSGDLIVIAITLLLEKILKKDIDVGKYWLFSYNNIFGSFSLNNDVIFRGIIVCVLSFIVFTAIGIISFKKRDI